MAYRCWGRKTGVTETTRTFTTDWTLGTAAITGSADAEQVIIDSGQTRYTTALHLGAGKATIALNKYGGLVLGSTPTVEYRTGASSNACVADTWHILMGTTFTSNGWIALRVGWARVIIEPLFAAQRAISKIATLAVVAMPSMLGLRGKQSIVSKMATVTIQGVGDFVFKDDGTFEWADDGGFDWKDE